MTFESIVSDNAKNIACMLEKEKTVCEQKNIFLGLMESEKMHIRNKKEEIIKEVKEFVKSKIDMNKYPDYDFFIQFTTDNKITFTIINKKGKEEPESFEVKYNYILRWGIEQNEDIKIYSNCSNLVLLKLNIMCIIANGLKDTGFMGIDIDHYHTLLNHQTDEFYYEKKWNRLCGK